MPRPVQATGEAWRPPAPRRRTQALQQSVCSTPELTEAQSRAAMNTLMPTDKTQRMTHSFVAVATTLRITGSGARYHDSGE